MKKNNNKKTWKKSGRERKKRSYLGTVLIKLEGLSRDLVSYLKRTSQNTGKSVSKLIDGIVSNYIKEEKDKECI